MGNIKLTNESIKMRKFLILCLLFILLFGFCKKSGTETASPDDNITLEVTVLENGVPKAGIYVKVTALVKVFSHSRGEGSNVVGEYFNEAQDEEVLTNIYGISIFRYENKSVPEYNGVVVQKVELKYRNDILITDDEDKIIEKNGSLELEYDIGG